MNNALIYVVREKEEGKIAKVSPFINLNEAISYAEKFVGRTNKKRISAAIETIDGRLIAHYCCKRGGSIEKNII